MHLPTRAGAVALAALLTATTLATDTISADVPEPSTVPAPGGPQPAALADKPNIVLITADDMRPGDLKAMPFTRTVVARRGVRFTDAISPYSLCCPARAEIVTGQYSHNNGVRGNKWPNGGYWALTGQRNTLPVWLRQAGYRTGFVGKYLNGYEARKVPECGGQPWCAHLAGRSPHEIPPGWTRWYASVARTYAYWGVTLRVGGVGRTPSYETSDRYQSYLYADIVTKRMIPDFLASDKTVDRPFFVWFSSATPHTAPPAGDGHWQPPVPFSRDPDRPRSGAHWRQFADEQLPAGDVFRARFNEDVSDKAGPMTNRRPVSRRLMTSAHRHRLASLLSLDDAVERIVTKLRATGEWDNTVLIFTSDNGYAIGEHRVHGKNLPYDAILEVPMIVSAPGLKQRYRPGATANTMVTTANTVTTLDIPSTIVTLAGAVPGRAPEGIDMMRPRANPDFGPGDRAVLIEGGSNAAHRTAMSTFVGVRTDRWRWFGWDAEPVGGRLQFNVLGRFRRAIELYDHQDDPAQVTNIHGREHLAQDRLLRQMTQNRFDCVGRACVWAF